MWGGGLCNSGGVKVGGWAASGVQICVILSGMQHDDVDVVTFYESSS